MASFFNGTAEIKHVSKIPAGARREAAVAMLHDHVFFLHCDPHLSKLETLKTEAVPVVPDHVVPVGATECFKVTDIVHTIPAGLWDSNVVSRYEFTDMADGVFVRIKSPLSVVMDTMWRVVVAGSSESQQQELELVEEVTVRCSRLLLPVVRSQVDAEWAKIHEKMIAHVMNA